jgi:alpha-L-rhamnosidase
VTFARAVLKTQYGPAASAWKIDGGRLQLDVKVPANTRATVRLPGATLASVLEGANAVTGASGVTSARQDGTAVVVEVGSGDYVFSYPRN